MANTTQASAPPAQAEVGHDSGGGHANFPPFETSTFPSQLLWLAIAFGALYYYMSKRFLPGVGAVIESRRARIAKDLDDATAMQQKADAAAAAHEKQLADARRKAVEDELAAKLAASEAQIAATRAQAMTNVAAIAKETTGAIVERLIGRPADPSLVANAVDSVKAN